MSFIPAILGLFNFKVKESTFDGNKPIQNGRFKGRDGDYLDIEFEKPARLNLITLFEKGESVTDFEIYAETDGDLKMIYKQNRISKFRVCAVDDVETEKFELKFSKREREHSEM